MPQAGLDSSMVGPFVNDWIIRVLAGVTSDERPIFLKVGYNGADALAELAEHDTSLVVGVLGGAAGTTATRSSCCSARRRTERVSRCSAARSSTLSRRLPSSG